MSTRCHTADFGVQKSALYANSVHQLQVHRKCLPLMSLTLPEQLNLTI